jgi:hypothetical protein
LVAYFVSQGAVITIPAGAAEQDCLRRSAKGGIGSNPAGVHAAVRSPLSAIAAPAGASLFGQKCCKPDQVPLPRRLGGIAIALQIIGLDRIGVRRYRELDVGAFAPMTALSRRTMLRGAAALPAVAEPPMPT